MSSTPFEGQDDVVLPFAVEPLDVRGRIVRLGVSVDAILSRHAYPAPVSRVLGEAGISATATQRSDETGRWSYDLSAATSWHLERPRESSACAGRSPPDDPVKCPKPLGCSMYSDRAVGK